MHSHWKCIYLVQSFNCTVLIVPKTRQCMYTFYCLGNMLSLCAEKFCLFLCLERMPWTALFLTPSPLNIIWSSSENKSNYEWSPGIFTCSFFNISGKSKSSTVNPLSLSWIFSEIAHSSSPWSSSQSSAELRTKGFG